MSIRPLPPVPTRDDPANFALKGDAFLAALPEFRNDCNALIQSLQLVATTGTSTSSLTVGLGSKSLTTDPGKAWATGAWVYVFAAAAVSNYMVGRVTSYDVDTGALVVNVSAIDGSGTHVSWIIGLATPAADGHLLPRDGTRAMTAELPLAGDAVNALGAVPKQQAESIAAAAATDLAKTVSALSFSGLALSATGTNASVAIAANELLLRGADGSPHLVSGVSLSLNTAGTGANGLDTGTLAASTWYAVWVISNGTTTATLLSLSSTAPTMPSGYTHKARVGWIRTDSTANKHPARFTQFGRRVDYAPATGTNLTAYPTLFSGSTSGPASLASFIPATAGVVRGLVQYSATNTASISSEDGAQLYIFDSGTGPAALRSPFEVITRTRAIVVGSSGAAAGLVVGWEDNL